MRLEENAVSEIFHAKLGFGQNEWDLATLVWMFQEKVEFIKE